MGSESTNMTANVSVAHALAMIGAGIEKGRLLGKGFSIAVVDASGILKAFARMDGAALMTVQIAQDKAYTAAGFGLATHVWHDVIKDDAPLAAGAPSGIDRLVIFGGGFPIEIDGQVVGGVGVSGGHYHEDMEVAEVCLAV